MEPKFLLADFGVIHITGADSRELLNNLLSNDILNLNAGSACFATLNTPQGRVIANFIVLSRGPEEFLLIIKKELLLPLIKKLTLYRLRSKVELKAEARLSVRGNIEKRALTDPLPLSFPFREEDDRIVIPCPTGAVFFLEPRDKGTSGLVTDPNEWEDYHVEHGFTWLEEATSGLFVAQMLNLEILGAVNFKKGCYPGQEVIARAQYRGEVKKRPALLTGAVMPAAGAKIIDEDEEEVGIVTGAARDKNGEIKVLAVAKLNIPEAVAILGHDKAIPLQLVKLFYEPKN